MSTKVPLHRRFNRQPDSRPPEPGAEMGHLLPKREIAFSSAVAFTGLTVARVLGFLFSVAAARILVPGDYGRVAYALAITALASGMLSSSPIGLSRFLARETQDRFRQHEHFSNWIGVVGLLLGASLLVAGPISAAAGLSRGLAGGASTNLIGTAVLQPYRERQRGTAPDALQPVCYNLP